MPSGRASGEARARSTSGFARRRIAKSAVCAAVRDARCCSPPATLKLAAVRRPASDPVDELIEREDHEELERLARVILSGLSSRQRAVVALHTRGLRRRQIAEHLDLTSRTVKRSMEQVLAAGRNELLRLAGQGCGEGEQLVARLAFGLAGPREARRAQLHLATCGRCGALYERLDLWREHVAGLLPLPAAAEAHLICSSARSTPAASCCRGRLIAAGRRRATARDGDGVASARSGRRRATAGGRSDAARRRTAGCGGCRGGRLSRGRRRRDLLRGAGRRPDRGHPHDRVARAAGPQAEAASASVRLSQAPTVPIATPTVPAPTATPTASATPVAAQPTSEPPPPQPTSTPAASAAGVRADRGRKQQRIGQFAAGRRHPASQHRRRVAERVRWPMSTDRERRIMRTRRAGRSIAAAIVLSIVLAGTVSAPAAGQFTVASCQADRLNFSTTAFSDFATRGMRIRRACNPEARACAVSSRRTRAAAAPCLAARWRSWRPPRPRGRDLRRSAGRARCGGATAATRCSSTRRDRGSSRSR